MLVFDGKLALTSTTDIKWHKISGFNEIAYSFATDGSTDRYCILANNLLALAVDETGMSTDLSEVDYWIKNSTQGDDITIDTLKKSYGEDVTALATLIVFQDQCFYLDHATSFIYHVPDFMVVEMKQFYFGDPSFNKDTVTESFESTGICSLDGVYSFIDYSAKVSQLRYDYSNFFFTEPEFKKIGAGQMVEMSSLYVGSDCLISGVVSHDLTNDGFYFSGLNNKQFYALYQAADGTGGISASIIDYKYGTFVMDKAFFLVQNSISIKFPMCADNMSVDEKTGNRTLDLGDIKLEFAFKTYSSPYVHIVGYQMHAQDGAPVRWGGQSFTFQELEEAGLDHDLTDNFAAHVSTTMPLDSSNCESTEMLEPVSTGSENTAKSTQDDFKKEPEVLHQEQSDFTEKPSKIAFEESETFEESKTSAAVENDPKSEINESLEQPLESEPSMQSVPSLLARDQLDPSTLFRDVRVDQLYNILTNNTLVF